MEQLRIMLLGTFKVQIADAVLSDFHSNRVRALLAYLVVEADRPHERELLAGLFWPNAPLDKGLGSLRQLLHRLGQTLKPLSEAEPLQITRQAIQWNPALKLEVDSQQFDQLAGGVETHHHRR